MPRYKTRGWLTRKHSCIDIGDVVYVYYFKFAEMFVFFMFLVYNIMIIAAAHDKSMYTTKYDDVDIDAVINSDRLLKNYIGCLLDENPCTPDGAELKKNLPDALATHCEGCSEVQKNNADKIYHHLIDNKPDDWARLEKRYDPSGSYKKEYIESKNIESTTLTEE